MKNNIKDSKIDISSLSLSELREFVIELSLKLGIKIEKFRAEQIYKWLISGVSEFDEMKNVPLNIRTALKENCYIALPAAEKKFVSKLDGTIKYLFRLYDGECIESVFMRYEHGNTVCISTISGFSRNLTPSEILGQIVAVSRDTGEKISNVVLMGIGEPLDNFENVLKFLELVNAPEGMNIGYRHISLSTCGIVPNILKLSEKQLPITLSISLHSTTQEERERLMPIAKKYSLKELISACRKYIDNGGRRISFEYAMIENENDSKEDAQRLASLLSGMLCHVNLIPLNTVSGRDYRKSGRDAIKRFMNVLESKGIIVTVRRRLGSDIDASCGQLRASKISEN